MLEFKIGIDRTSDYCLITVKGHCIRTQAEALEGVIDNCKHQTGIIIDLQEAILDSSGIGALLEAQFKPKKFKLCLVGVSPLLTAQMKKLRIYQFFTIFIDTRQAVSWICS